VTISDEMYRRIIEAVPEGIWVVDSEGKTLFSNRRMAEILGVDFESMPAQSCFGCVFPEELADAQRHFARALSGDSQPFDFRLRRGDGSPIWVSISCMPVRGVGPAAAPVGLLGLFSDISQRKQSEALLRESEERFRFLVDVAPVMVWVAGQDKLCTDFNKPWLDFTGRSLQQELGNGWSSGVHPEDLDQCMAHYITSFDARRDFRMEYRLRRADGEYRWVLDSGMPFYREGEFSGYVGTCIDITEQKLLAERTRAEAALRESEERQKFLLALSDALRPLGEPISIQETATQLVAEYLALDGCAYGEVDVSEETFTVDREYKASGVQSFVGAHRIQDFGQIVIDRCRAGLNTTISDALTDPLAATPDGIDKYVRVDIRAFVAIPVLKDARLRALLFGYSRAVRNWTRLESELMADVADRTWSAVERARGEAELRKSEERLRLAAHAARFGTYDVDLVTNTVYWSSELREIVGVPADAPAPPARHVPDFVHPEDRGRVDAMFSRVFDSGGTVLDEHRIIRPDGSVRWVQIRGQTQFAGEAESGRAVRHAGVMLDITERKRDEERLRQSQKLESVGLLAGGIAHDFNNLLTGIVGYASLVLEEIPPGPAAKIREVIAGAERAAHLTRQLLAYSGKGQFKVEDVDVARAVEEIADLARFSIPKSVQLSVNVEKRLPLVRMDPGQLQQILMNLVINAGEAVGEGVPGRITVGTSMRDIETAFTDARGEQVAPGRYVCIEISDTGEGIREEDKRRIFEPFYTTKFTGRGLGLAAVEGILRAQRCGITIESARGAGSCFRIFLPAAENSARATVQLGQTGDFGTVLVVDDERSVRDFIGEALRRNGYRVLLASDGREALAICENGEEKIDAMVLDTIMPLMGAKELLALIPGIRPNLRVLLTSGYSESEVRRLCVDYPATDFIGKPYTAHQISKAVENLLERREGRRNRQLPL
jgi:PAS domain S-box-containing protein